MNRRYIVFLVKGGHRYFFIFDVESGETLMDILFRFSEDPELNFDPDDAAAISERVRQILMNAE